MKQRAVTAAAMAFGTLASLSAQAPRPKTAASPKTPWGHPDLQGRWTTATLTPLERPSELGAKEFFTEDEAREYSKTALDRFLKQNNLVDEAAISGEFE